MNKDQKTANPEQKPKEEDPAAVLEALMAAADQQLCQQYRDSVTKESMSGTYPDSDRSEDRQPLVGGGAGGSACPGRDREAERSSGSTSAPPQPEVVASNCKEPAPPANEAPPQPDVTKESIARPYPNSDRAEDQQPLTKESMARPYPDSDSSEDQQPLVSGASFCKPAPQPPVPPKQTPRNAPCPCGSGQKYKRCHGGPNAPAQKQAA